MAVIQSLPQICSSVFWSNYHRASETDILSSDTASSIARKCWATFAKWRSASLVALFSVTVCVIIEVNFHLRPAIEHCISNINKPRSQSRNSQKVLLFTTKTLPWLSTKQSNCTLKLLTERGQAAEVDHVFLYSVCLVGGREIHAYHQLDLHDPTAWALERLLAVFGSDASGFSTGQLGIAGGLAGSNRWKFGDRINGSPMHCLSMLDSV
jgi:hypothetical protein